MRTDDRRVFVVNEPLRRNPETGAYEPFLPLDSAADYGEVVELTAKGNPGSNLAGAMRAIRAGLDRWRDGDYVVLVGDQALLAYAASVIGEKIAAAPGAAKPQLRLLKWERREERYVPLTMREALPVR